MNGIPLRYPFPNTSASLVYFVKFITLILSAVKILHRKERCHVIFLEVVLVYAAFLCHNFTDNVSNNCSESQLIFSFTHVIFENKEKLDWANSAPTYPQTGHHSRHRF